MSGIAITIPNANFGSRFGNQITDLIDTPVTSIKIFANDYYVGTQYQLSATYEPLKTSQRGCTWSVISGDEYCCIDRTTGVLTIFEPANMTSVVIRATSIYDPSVFNDKEIVLVYKRSAVPERMVKSVGTLTNVTEEADLPLAGRKMLVKEDKANSWTLQSAPPSIITTYTEDEVMKMIDEGTIDDNTLYFCEE